MVDRRMDDLFGNLSPACSHKLPPRIGRVEKVANVRSVRKFRHHFIERQKKAVFQKEQIVENPIIIRLNIATKPL